MFSYNFLYYLVIASVTLIKLSESCNELVCASVVTKCMLTQSCNCDLATCHCCKECSSCLSYLYTECCSCVDMCPLPDESQSHTKKKSHVEDLGGIPMLFETLTDDGDSDGRWSVYTYPVELDGAVHATERELDLSLNLDFEKPDLGLNSPIKVETGLIQVNCTVAYISQCLSWNKCKENCESMGANSYRWFHDGCCECVGHTCINYGINDGRCLDCPLDGDFDDEDLDDLDYGDAFGDMIGNLM